MPKTWEIQTECCPISKEKWNFCEIWNFAIERVHASICCHFKFLKQNILIFGILLLYYLQYYLWNRENCRQYHPWYYAKYHFKSYYCQQNLKGNFALLLNINKAKEETIAFLCNWSELIHSCMASLFHKYEEIDG